MDIKRALFIVLIVNVEENRDNGMVLSFLNISYGKKYIAMRVGVYHYYIYTLHEAVHSLYRCTLIAETYFFTTLLRPTTSGSFYLYKGNNLIIEFAVNDENIWMI